MRIKKFGDLVKYQGNGFGEYDVLVTTSALDLAILGKLTSGKNILRDNSSYLEKLMQAKKSRSHRKEIILEYARETGMRGFCFLAAHGGLRPSRRLLFRDILKNDRNAVFEWIYSDGKRVNPVQKWINEQDGKYLVLFPIVCNPMNLNVESNHSILFFPDNNYSLLGYMSTIRHGRGLVWNNVQIRMFIPGYGYHDDIPQRKIGRAQLLSYFLERKEGYVSR